MEFRLGNASCGQIMVVGGFIMTRITVICVFRGIILGLLIFVTSITVSFNISGSLQGVLFRWFGTYFYQTTSR